MTSDGKDGSANQPAAPPAGGLFIEYPAELPISARVADIQQALETHAVVIVAGATGSGKTTQLPKIALEVYARRRRQERDARGSDGAEDKRVRRTQQVAVTQPRRIAATSVASRVASELQCQLGKEVGYQIRFDDKSGPETELKFMTDGILLATIQGDPLFKRYHTIIIDEAHERSLTIDFLLGWLKQILPKRPELKVIVSSATIETARFSEFFDGAPVIEVKGRTFPVDVLYEPPDPDLDPREAVANAVESMMSLDSKGDFLVFLPGEREIAETEKILQDRRLFHTEVLPLYGRLSAAEQGKVFTTGVRRRVILATNVAETSLTLPGIVYVIDTGVARLARYDPRTGTTRLQIEQISQASADQRKGRSGRVREGICVRLYDEASFQGRPAFTDPEVRRVGLAGVILRMKSAGLGDIEQFPFLDAPQPRAVAEGYRVLEELGALTAERALTELGRRLAQFPVDPRIARMIIAGADNGCLDEILVLAAALEIRDPRERPRGFEQKADQQHQRFQDKGSDFVSLLKLWSFIGEAKAQGGSHLKRVCQQTYLSFARVREWREVHRQLESTVHEMKLRKGLRREKLEVGEVVHLSLLSGLLSRIGIYEPEKRSYQGARQTRFVLHPSSAMAKQPPAWVMAFELVETSQLYARTVAKIEPEWLDKVAGHLLTRRYSEPHWSEKSARASVREHATLFGLPVLKDRSVDYATVAPGRARLMFIEHALVRGEYSSKGDFQAKNRALFETLGRLRGKARKSDMLADADALLTFFDLRVAKSVVNGKTFEEWREQAEKQQPQLLELAMSDVLSADEQLVPEHYPDELTIAGARLDLRYRFEPREDNDGVTLVVPLALAARLTPNDLDWTIPAWHERRICELLERLPKAQRRRLGDLSELSARVAPLLKPFAEPFLPSLVRAIEEATAERLPQDNFRTDTLPGYLRLTCCIVDEKGKVLEQSRELEPLLRKYGARARVAIAEHHPAPVQHKQLTQWNFGELKAVATRHVLGVAVHVYPALVDHGDSVELTFKDSEAAALLASAAGVRRLLALALAKPLSQLAKRVPAPFARRAGLPPSQGAKALFCAEVLSRVVKEAFPIDDPRALPRDARAFDALLMGGALQLETAAAAVFAAVHAASAELELTLRALDQASKQAAAAGAIREMQQQLNLLHAEGLVADEELAQLCHIPRYHRAIRVRLERALNDPRKDAAKAEPLLPLWQAFLAKRSAARDQASARALRWAFEELRVAIFAPELKPAYSVRVASLAQAVSALE